MTLVSRLFALALLAGAPLLASETTPAPSFRQGIEAQALSLNLLVNDFEVVTVVTPPEHGQLLPISDVRTYQPAADFFGRDRFVVERRNTVTGQRQRVSFDIEVLPRYQHLQGRWEEGGSRKPGFYDTLERTLVLCPSQYTVGVDGGQPYVQLVCTYHPVDGVPAGAVAVMIDGDDGGKSATQHGADTAVAELALFHPPTGRLYWLGQADAALQVLRQQELLPARDSFPVFGRWEADAPGAIAFVDREGGVLTLREEGSLIEWPQPLLPWSSDAAVWPMRWPLLDRDVLALMERSSGDVLLTGADGYLGVDPCLCELRDPQRPLHAALLLADVKSPLFLRTIHFLQGSDATGLFLGMLLFGDYKDPFPQTMPIKFPGDPTG